MVSRKSTQSERYLKNQVAPYFLAKISRSGRELGSHEKDEGTDLLGTEIGKKQCSKIGQSQSLGLFIFSKEVPMCSQ